MAIKYIISEKCYREMFENANEAMFVHDLDGYVIAANNAAGRQSGYSVRELMEMNVRDFLSSSALGLAREVRRKLLEGEDTEQPYEQHLIMKNGTQAIVMLTTSVVFEDRVPIGFQNIGRDVTEERRMRDSLHYYIEQITMAQEKERKRIARELHDDTAQALYGVIRLVDNFVRSKKSLPKGESEFLGNLGEQLRNTLQGVRNFSQDLRPPILDDLGLLPTLRWLVNELNEHHGIEGSLKVLGAERRLSPETELAIFRILQEVIRNVVKHAEASHVEVVVAFENDKIRISASDNGTGFVLTNRLGDLPRKGKLGLVGVDERVRLLGGSLRIASEPGSGTELTVEVPT